MTDIEKNLEEHTRSMLEGIFTRADLNTLAGALGIKTGEIDKDGLIDKLCGTSLSKAQYAALYEELSPSLQIFLHYLGANQGAVKLEEAAKFLEGWDVIQKRGYFSLYGADLRKVFSQFKGNLAAKGLALIIENPPKYRAMSKFERFSLYLPGQYSDLLPPLPVEGEKMTQAGERKSFDDFAKDILFSSLRLREAEDKTIKKMISHIFWKDKKLLFWEDSWILKSDAFLANIYSAWKKERAFKSINIATNLFYVLKGIAPDEWMKLPNLVESFGRLTCFLEPDKIKKTVSNFCCEAFDAGLLERIDAKSGIFYRLNRESFPFADSSDDRRVQPRGIHIEKDGSLRVDRNETPVHVLLEVLLLSDWSHGDNSFICHPSLLRLGKYFRKFSHFSNLHLYNLFMNNSKSYRQALQRVEEDFGKFMIHANLSIFEIKDITISTLLKHKFPEKIHSLGRDFFVTAEKDEPDITRFLQQNKYSIRIQGKSENNAFA